MNRSGNENRSGIMGGKLILLSIQRVGPEGLGKGKGGWSRCFNKNLDLTNVKSLGLRGASREELEGEEQTRAIRGGEGKRC